MIQVCPVPFPAHTLSGAEGRALHSRRSCTDLRSAPWTSSPELPETPQYGFKRRRLTAMRERDVLSILWFSRQIAVDCSINWVKGPPLAAAGARQAAEYDSERKSRQED